MSQEEVESVQIPELFQVYHNKDYTCNAISVLKIQTLLKQPEHKSSLEELEQTSQSSEDQQINGGRELTFEAAHGTLKVTLQVVLVLCEAKRRQRKDAVAMTISMQITSAKDPMNCTLFSSGERIPANIKIYPQNAERPTTRACSVSVNEPMKAFAVEKADIGYEDDVIALDLVLDLSCLEETHSEDYPGLVNNGMTCYMNSYLQALFHIKIFVRCVFMVNWE